MGDGFDALHVPETETGALSDDPIQVLQQLDELIRHMFVCDARTAEGDGSNSPHVGVVISKQPDKSVNHGRTAKLGLREERG